MLRVGVDPFSLSVRQIVSVAESWFLSFFEPHEWGEVRERLEGVNSGESTTITDSQGAPIPVSRKAIADMEELLAAAGGGAATEAVSGESF